MILPNDYVGSLRPNVTFDATDLNDESADVYVIDKNDMPYFADPGTLQYHGECGREQAGIVMSNAMITGKTPAKNDGEAVLPS